MAVNNNPNTKGLPSGGIEQLGQYPLMVRDSRLAETLFRESGGPKPKYMFYVRFVRLGGNKQPNKNYDIISSYLGLGMSSETGTTRTTSIVGDITKQQPTLTMNVDRPNINFDLETLNSYGVKRVIQKKIEYAPLSIRFYDTNDNRMWKMFQEYYGYYYGEGNALDDVAWSRRTIDNEMYSLPGSHWGYNVRDTDFFARIEIYEFYAAHYTRFDLVNPKIQSFKPDELDAAAGNVAMHINMQVAYEGLVMQAINQPLTPDMVNEFGFNLSNFYDVPGDAQYAHPFGRFDIVPPGTKVTDEIINNLVNQLAQKALNRMSGVQDNAQFRDMLKRSVLNSIGNPNYGQAATYTGNGFNRPYTMDNLLYDVASGNNMNRAASGLFTGSTYNSTARTTALSTQPAQTQTGVRAMDAVQDSDVSTNSTYAGGNFFDQAFGVTNTANKDTLQSSILAAGVLSAAYRTGLPIEEIVSETSTGLHLSDAGLAGVNVLRPTGSQIGRFDQHNTLDKGNPIKTRMDSVRKIDDKFFR